MEDKLSLSTAQGAGQALPEEHDDRRDGTSDRQWNDNGASNGLQQAPEPPGPSNYQANRTEHHSEDKKFGQIKEPDAEKHTALPPASNGLAQQPAHAGLSPNV
jgi:hypothetical protein